MQWSHVLCVARAGRSPVATLREQSGAQLRHFGPVNDTGPRASVHWPDAYLVRTHDGRKERSVSFLNEPSCLTGWPRRTCTR
jgi:hypothetical protein